VKWRLAAFVVGVSVLATAAPAGAQELADATCPGPATSGRANGPGTNFGSSRFAQTFTAQHTGTLTTVQLGVGPNGSFAPDWVVQILSASGGAPASSGTLGSSTIDDATIPTTGPTLGAVTAHPTPAPAVTAGQEYAVAVTHPGGDSVGVRTVPGDPCPGDLFFTGPAPDPFGPEGSTDEMVFAVFVTPAAPQAPTQPAGKRRKCKRKKKGAKPHTAAKKKCKKKKKRR
jgi:hypothetical protein